MGGATRQKQEALIDAEAKFQQRFADATKKLEAKLAEPIPHVSEDFTDFEGFFIRDKNTFSLKTKSKDRNKQRLEFVRHVFHKFPVPEFMFEAWKEHTYYKKFITKEDYRLWYICIATGGSFYKEYGNHLFTKKESHAFLNCKCDITIDQAIVYAIAYTESNDLGKSLRIANSKINTFDSTPYWREVVRFFARQESVSKETIDDIVDYIVYKKADNPEFTIIGVGHTIKSLKKKVEDWHQDLRRLKLIGDHFWEGVPVKDAKYTQKNSLDLIDLWEFTQIKSSKALQREGNAMRHCVLSYKNDCIANKCSIWSLTFNGDRKLTIEVQKNRITQVRGKANRLTRPHERNIIKTWAKHSGFSGNY